MQDAKLDRFCIKLKYFNFLFFLFHLKDCLIVWFSCFFSPPFLRLRWNLLFILSIVRNWYVSLWIIVSQTRKNVIFLFTILTIILFGSQEKTRQMKENVEIYFEEKWNLILEFELFVAFENIKEENRAKIGLVTQKVF